ncbi:MAG: 2-isopropylmalate synthase [Anaerolineae bacterium]|nr:2-isopropylmalate synthase [Anaerolineae bacterium]
MDRVLIFDTTLRDGEQTPGVALNAEEKVQIARQLARLGVDIIEAGFPAASPGDWEAVKRVAMEVQGPVIAALARATPGDIERAWEAIRFSPRPRIHTFLASSDIHLKYKLRMSREEVLERVRDMVAYARNLCDDVEFSPEDASRSDPEFLYRVVETAIRAGATTINIPDTVGYALPEEFGALIRGILEHVPGADRVTISAHCHNDLGLATANSLAAIQAGARQVECTINGLGERAGNASLEEIVMALYTRRQVLQVTTGIRLQEIYRTSRMVASYTGVSVQPNKAIVGANAFAHESGIHQDGVLKNPLTYEIMDPKTIGLDRSLLVLGKHSGRHALRKKLEEMGYQLPPEELERVFASFKALADRKKEVTEADLEALISDEMSQATEGYQLEHVQVCCGNIIPTATIRISGPQGQTVTETAIGNGPVDAVYQAITRVVGISNRLVEFSIKAVTGGLDAVGEVTIRIETEDGNGHPRVFSGYGASTDIILASARAYISALNKALSARRTAVPEPALSFSPTTRS